MVSSVHGLSFLVGLLLAAAGPSHAYKIRAGPVYEVPEADRVSAKQLFARDTDIFSNGLPNIKLVVGAPGRVYIRHVENATAVAAGLYGKLRASGDTRAAVELIASPKPSIEVDDWEELDIFMDSADWSAHTTESLLLEIEFYNKNVLRSLSSHGSAATVVLEDVLFAPQGKTMADVVTIDTSSIYPNMMSGDVFVSDSKTRFSTSSLSVYARESSTVQLEFGSLNCSVGGLSVSSDSTSNVAVFTSELSGPVSLGVSIPRGETTSRNPLCVAAENDVQLSWTTLTNKLEDPTQSTISGGSACTKLAIPPREPSLIGNDATSTSGSKVKEATPVTFPPPGTAPPATPTPAPTSAASSLVSSPVVAILVTFFLDW